MRSDGSRAMGTSSPRAPDRDSDFVSLGVCTLGRSPVPSHESKCPPMMTSHDSDEPTAEPDHPMDAGRNARPWLPPSVLAAGLFFSGLLSATFWGLSMRGDTTPRFVWAPFDRGVIHLPESALALEGEAIQLRYAAYMARCGCDIYERDDCDVHAECPRIEDDSRAMSAIASFEECGRHPITAPCRVDWSAFVGLSERTTSRFRDLVRDTRSWRLRAIRGPWVILRRRHDPARRDLVAALIASFFAPFGLLFQRTRWIGSSVAVLLLAHGLKELARTGCDEAFRWVASPTLLCAGLAVVLLAVQVMRSLRTGYGDGDVLTSRGDVRGPSA